MDVVLIMLIGWLILAARRLEVAGREARVEEGTGGA